MDQKSEMTETTLLTQAEIASESTAQQPAMTSTRYEQSSQKVTEELSLKELTKIFTGNWLLFLLIFVAMAVSSIGIYIFKIPFVSSGSVVVNDTQNSSLQSFASQFFGLTKSVADGKKNNSPLQKHAEYLKTEEFFNQLLTNITALGESQDLSVAERKGYLNFKEQYLNEPLTAESKVKVIQKLDSLAKIKLNSEFQINVAFSSPDKETALFLNNVALKTIAESLKQKELLDFIKVEAFIKSQRVEAEQNMADFNKKLADFQNKPENLISLSSKDKVGEYLSELMVRKNEIRMKIAENQKVIEYLSQGTSGRRESQLYGNGGRAQSLKIENEMHMSKLNDIQNSIDRVTSQAKTIPVAGQIFEELKKKSEIEFSKYKDLTEALAKVEAQRLSIQSRFEILEKGRLETVVPQISLLILLMLSLVLSQIIGCLVIYVIYIWDSNAVTAHASRDIVILDSHSLDPRVIIENTKIRFRLRNTEFSEESNRSINDVTPKKLSFKLFNKQDASGDSK